MKLLLDSDAISALGEIEGENHKKVIHCLNSFSEPEMCVSMLTIYELEYSIAAAIDQDLKEKIKQSIDHLKTTTTIINLGFKDAEVYGQLKKGFKERTGIKTSPLKRHSIDIALASVAIANNCLLIGQDSIYSDHLQYVDSRLQHRDWSK